MLKRVNLMFSFIISIFVFSLLAQTPVDSLCYMQSKGVNCIEAVDGDTVYVDWSTQLLGSDLTLCPASIGGETPVSFMIAYDVTWSMQTSDPQKFSDKYARVMVDSISARSLRSNIPNPHSWIGVVNFNSNVVPVSSKPIIVNGATSRDLVKSWIVHITNK